MENNQKNQVAQIRDAYLPEKRTKLDELRSLDRKVKRPALVFGYTFGTAGALVLGTGMCLTMGVIGAALNPAAAIAVGIVVGVAGIAVCASNYFIYKKILKKRKEKYAEKVLALSGEALNLSAE